jgi:hypothetical protein
MSVSRQLDSSRLEENALPPEVVLEIRGLKAVHKILVKKVMQLEDLIAELRKARSEVVQNVRVSSSWIIDSASRGG